MKKANSKFVLAITLSLFAAVLVKGEELGSAGGSSGSVVRDGSGFVQEKSGKSQGAGNVGGIFRTLQSVYRHFGGLKGVVSRMGAPALPNVVNPDEIQCEMMCHMDEVMAWTAKRAYDACASGVPSHAPPARESCAQLYEHWQDAKSASEDCGRRKEATCGANGEPPPWRCSPLC